MTKISVSDNLGGRPTKYRDEYIELAYKVCLLGATDRELGDFFEVDEATINKWKIDHPEFYESIRKGKSNADANVADRLYQRARGFEHDSEEIKIVANEVVHVRTRKIYPPDTTAAIFWLKNRQRDKWRDKTEVDANHSGEVGVSLSADQAEQLIRARAKRSDS